MEKQDSEMILNQVTNLSNELDKFYPELTTYESLKLATEMTKINSINNVYFGLNEIIDTIDSKEVNDYSDITICLDQIEKSLDYMTEIIKNKTIDTSY